MDLRLGRNLQIFSVMSYDQQKLTLQMEIMLGQLTEIVSGLRAGSEEWAALFPADAAEKVRKRICLRCGEVVPKGKRYRRGLDSRHWGEIWDRTIKKGKLTEPDAIRLGLIAPEGSVVSERDELAPIIKARRESLAELKQRAATILPDLDQKVDQQRRDAEGEQ